MGKLLNEAIIFAVRAHEGGKRKGSDLPYIVHPLEVLAIVATMTDDEAVLAAAVLHDVVEDTVYTLTDIEKNFGAKVASYVDDESENKREDRPAADTWKIRKTETIEHLKSARLETKMITLGDKLSNIRSMRRDYKALGEELLDRFNQKNKAEHAWYYGSICDILAKTKLANTEAFIEFEALIAEVFS